MIGLQEYLILAAALFGIGVAGVLTRKNIFIVFMSVELMLNAVNLTLLAFSRHLANANGHVFVFLILALAAAEAALGLAIVILLYRNKESLNVDDFSLLKE